MADKGTHREFTAERSRRLAFFGRGAPPPAASIRGFDEPETSVESLHWELSQLKDSIDHMKMEIAALRSDRTPPPPLDAATCELDAVVRATETATHTILEAAEHIDTLLLALRGSHSAPDATAVAGIGEQVVRIFEACNFQDITGQRITKVVAAIKFIEGRIDRMIEILGGQGALRDVELPPAEIGDADAALLAGPQLETDPKISQNDIDRFFD